MSQQTEVFVKLTKDLFCSAIRVIEADRNMVSRLVEISGIDLSCASTSAPVSELYEVLVAMIFGVRGDESDWDDNDIDDYLYDRRVLAAPPNDEWVPIATPEDLWDFWASNSLGPFAPERDPRSLSPVAAG